MSSSGTFIKLWQARLASFVRKTCVTVAIWEAYEVALEGMHNWASVHAFWHGRLIYFDCGDNLNMLILDLNTWIKQNAETLGMEVPDGPSAPETTKSA